MITLKNMLLGASFQRQASLILRLIISFKFFFRRLAQLVTRLVFMLVGVCEEIVYTNKIKKIKLEKDPIFILGHWRSGTSFLHCLLAKDPQFIYSKESYAIAPHTIILLEKALQSTLMEKLFPDLRNLRPQDNMFVDLESPEEEEFAIAKLTRQSLYNRRCIRSYKKAGEFFEKYVLFEGISQKDLDQLTRTYQFFIQKVCYCFSRKTNINGKQIILKNPVNTARIPWILKMYPKAKFIHIYRNPLDVIPSCIHTRNIFLNRFSRQSYSKSKIKTGTVINKYKALMTAYFKDKSQVPKNQLIEVKYEECIKNPLKSIKKIYQTLELDHYDQAEEHFKAYLESIKSYKKNKLELSKDDEVHITNELEFFFDTWGYRR